MSKLYSNIRLFSQIIGRAAACLVALVIFTAAASAATYTVDTTADDTTLSACTTAEAGDCSLRGAIGRANATTTEADTIDFALPAGSNTIILTGGELAINLPQTAGAALTITNSTGASNLLISGNNSSRVFFVRLGANLTLNGVTVTNGSFTTSGGGGILNNGTLSLLNSTVSGNTAAGDGGGISNVTGTLTLTNSTVSGNTGRNGGGIHSRFGITTTLTNSTVSGNRATSVGGGIDNSGTLSLTNSTVSGNRASESAGIFSGVSGTLNLTSVTVAFNTSDSIAGGVFNSGTANLRNTIVAQNIASDGVDFYGSISQGSSFNLIGNGRRTTGIANGTNGNQVGIPDNPIDPKLDPTLALNGGTTLNHDFLTDDSPAIDKGSDAGTDQRELTRPVDNPSIANATNGNGADIGAFEVQQITTAATVSVSGRVTARGRGISNAVVHLTSQNGEILTARTNRFGYYTFTELAVGETYIFNVFSKRYQFDPKVINLTEDLAELNFTAQ